MMVDTKEIEEMKKLGITKRKSEWEEGEAEYTFKLTCKECGEKVDWCNCTRTLEDAKKVIASEKKYFCWGCGCKPENCSNEINEEIKGIIKRFPGTSRSEAYMDILSEAYDGGDPEHESDGVAYWDCECAT